MLQSLRLAAALDGAGWHPAAWREPDARPGELFTAGYWADLAAEAERGLLDFVAIEDALAPETDRTDRVRGRLDAVLIASRVAPATRHLGFVPTVVATHTEPFHISKAIATLDYVSTGRAGVRVRISAQQSDVAALAAVTERLGLTGTINSTFSEPYEVARQFASLDHLSAGRAGWNVVTSWDAFTGENFRRGGFLPEDQRYVRAKRFLETAAELFDSWRDGDVVADRASYRFVAREDVGAFERPDEQFDISGRFTVPRSRRDGRSSCGPGTPRRASSSPPRRPTRSSPGTARRRPVRRSTPTSRDGWRSTGASTRIWSCCPRRPSCSATPTPRPTNSRTWSGASR